MKKKNDSCNLSQSFPAGSQYQPPDDEADETEQLIKCTHCGIEINEQYVQCTSPDCEGTDFLFHVECTVVVDSITVCLDCKRHQDGDSVSQADTQVEQ